jgi:hypothetical protein
MSYLQNDNDNNSDDEYINMSQNKIIELQNKIIEIIKKIIIRNNDNSEYVNKIKLDLKKEEDKLKKYKKDFNI